MAKNQNRCISPASFTLLLGVTAFIYIGAIGPYTSGILTTIQREFQLKSAEVGLLFTTNDIVGLVITTPVAYLGTSRHRPRILGAMTFVCALGCLCSALPQFMAGGDVMPSGPMATNAAKTPLSADANTSLCWIAEGDSPNNNKTDGGCTQEELASSGAQFDRAIWLIVGQVFIGIGGSGLFTLGMTHLDDGVTKKTSTPVYFASLFTLVGLCPIAAFALSGISLSLHTDFYKIDVDTLGYGGDDPRWIGAWWLGYIIFAVLLTLLSFPFFLFPKDWPKKDEDIELEENPTASKESKEDEFNTSAAFLIKPSTSKPPSTCMGLVKGYLSALFRLLTNVTYMAVVAGSIADGAMFVGFFGFLGRYLQTQYDVTPSMTSVILGAVTSAPMLIGNMLGGLLLKKLKLDTRGIALTVIIMSICTLIISGGFFGISCPTSPIAGINTPYADGSEPLIGSDIEPSCLSECRCEEGVYTPVCGADGITYITPCHAGCMQSVESSTQKIYSQCECIAGTPDRALYQRDASNTTQTSDVTMVTYFDQVYNTAIPEKCETDCAVKKFIFLILVALLLLIYALTHVPGFMLFLRSVEEQDRAVGLGVSSVLARCLAHIPAPIYFGAAIQTTCLMYQESCGKTGNCLIYDNVRLTNVLFGLVIVLKLFALGLHTCCYFSLRRNKEGVYCPLRLYKPDEEPAEDDV